MAIGGDLSPRVLCLLPFPNYADVWKGCLLVRAQHVRMPSPGFTTSVSQHCLIMLCNRRLQPCWEQDKAAALWRNPKVCLDMTWHGDCDYLPAKLSARMGKEPWGRPFGRNEAVNSCQGGTVTLIQTNGYRKVAHDPVNGQTPVSICTAIIVLSELLIAVK